jgi:hypothetical protein
VPALYASTMAGLHALDECETQAQMTICALFPPSPRVVVVVLVMVVIVMVTVVVVVVVVPWVCLDVPVVMPVAAR